MRGRTARELPELEAYRREALAALRAEAPALAALAALATKARVLGIYAVGSATDPDRFREDSDVDVAAVVDAPGPPGLDERASEAWQDALVRHPIGDVGVANGLVYRRDLVGLRGKSVLLYPRPGPKAARRGRVRAVTRAVQ